MSNDGSTQFYRLLDLDKMTKRLLYAFRYLKIQMSKEKDVYSNGIRYIDDE